MTDPVATIQLGDCRNIIAELPDCSVDSIVTDPPYELGFMGKRWDATGIAYDFELWRQCLRVLKPGGHLLAFGGTRTYHRMAVAIEDAGFEIRDSIHWLYGSGFPKSLDVSKAIDKAAGAEREVVGDHPYAHLNKYRSQNATYGTPNRTTDITAPATDAARQWEGWGTALKPAHEPIVVARKPLSGTVAATVLEHGTGALNIDGCRIATEDTLGRASGGWLSGGYVGGESPKWNSLGTTVEGGRWPANLVLTHHADCADQCAPSCPVAELDRQSGVSTSGAAGNKGASGFAEGYDGAYSVPYGDTGGASRFFAVTEWDPVADVTPFRYVAKPSRSERDAGLVALPKVAMDFGANGRPGAGFNEVTHGKAPAPAANHHPTVKPLALMRWLVRLVTPPGGTVLEPFAGSGTTMAAAILEDFHVIGCELTADYLPIIKGRIAWAHQERAATPLNLFDQAHSDD